MFDSSIFFIRGDEMIRCILMGALALSPFAASAQTLIMPAQTPAPLAQPAPLPPATTTEMLRTGTPVPMRTMVELTTKKKKLRVGERVPLEVAEAVRLKGQVVIPAGSPGMAEVTEVRNKGMWGKSGAISMRVLYVRIGDRQIRLSGTIDDKGVTGTGGVVAAVVLLPIAGFFTTGTSAVIAAGSPVPAFLDEDVAVAFAAPVEPLSPIAAAPAAAITPAAAAQ